VAEINICYVAKDGKKVIVEGFITCKFKDGVAEYTRGILRDVTKRKEDEKKLLFYNEQLSEREENLQELINSAPDSVIVIDEHNEILLWNPKSETIFGWKAEEVIGGQLANIIVPEELREAHRKGVERVVRTGETRLINSTVEVTAITKGENRIFIALTISRSKQAGKTIFIAFIRDITEQKKNQLELENKRIQLEQSNQQLEQYAWLASHDLKEPLRKIITYSDLLLTRHAKDLTETVAHHLRKINESTKRMGGLIEAILEYSNISETKELLVPTDLNLVVEEVLSDLEILIANKKGKVLVGKLPKIPAIRIQMQQLFQNIITNALKYKKHNVDPVIEIQSVEEDNHYRITIADNGIGFDNQYAEKIFVVFQRLHSGEKQEGTGIGLAICKKIVERHKGSIKAISRNGEGSVFEILLPVLN
jgi:PAS domain S-box-containing protein